VGDRSGTSRGRSGPPGNTAWSPPFVRRADSRRQFSHEPRGIDSRPLCAVPPMRTKITKIETVDGRLITEYRGGLIGATLDDLDLRRADLRGLVLEGASFSGADLTGADLSAADLYWASFFMTDLTGANLRNADMRGADLKSAKLVGCDLTNANLGIDNLGGPTKLQGANLERAILDDTRLAGAKYDEATIFPTGFQPQKAGMIRVQD
jgi:hypothetical protein